ncbi:unnamed protein product [Anisakis simplex]|uniref:Uncharacterized protein n=1 Tax=Anisakis simplex TaxID=6269 RepID=A0A0M3KJU2_ANISI|nr:unnamed protein product [Anisakis simplex]
MVRSLVGSFEAKVRVEAMPKGEMLSSSSEIKEGEETNKRQRKEGAYEKGSPPSPVTFRLEELTDWNRRHTLGAVPMPSSYVKNAVSSIQSEIRALTISQ